jgi:hypothetical protein
MKTVVVFSVFLMLLISPRLLLAQALPFTVQQVAVECDNRCDLITLGQACSPGFTPIAVDCQAVANQGSRIERCGTGPGSCARFPVLPSDRISDYCNDVGGFDANVYCARALDPTSNTSTGTAEPREEDVESSR